MEAGKLLEILGADFYTGVPDSQLKALCNLLIDKYGVNNNHHIIAANEGNAVALAAGYHLATGRIPVIYMQNSGEGNIINPVASLLDNKIYAIPEIFVIGWRGEPGVPDEPQHAHQGEITLKLLEDLNIEYFVIAKETSDSELSEKMKAFNEVLSQNRPVAFVVKKGALSYSQKTCYKNANTMSREEIIRCITDYSSEDLIISTTGKASRELFEIREQKGQGHKCDFLTVGSMGHCSSIAMGIALNKPDKRVWCIDGDGALLMHMGAMAVIGRNNPSNLIHVLINNSSHETVGGMPTVADNTNFLNIARACGYKYITSADNYEDLEKELVRIKQSECLTFIEIKCAIGARANLGRPTITPLDNKNAFMTYLQER